MDTRVKLKTWRKLRSVGSVRCVVTCQSSHGVRFEEGKALLMWSCGTALTWFQVDVSSQLEAERSRLTEEWREKLRDLERQLETTQTQHRDELDSLRESVKVLQNLWMFSICGKSQDQDTHSHPKKNISRPEKVATRDTLSVVCIAVKICSMTWR